MSSETSLGLRKDLGGLSSLDMFLINFAIQSFVMVSVLSVIWKDNIYFRIIAATYVGGSVGAYALLSLNAIYSGVVTPILKGNYLYVILFILGCMVLGNQLGKKVAWISRYPLWITMGIGTALAMSTGVYSQVIVMIKSMLSFVKIGSTPFDTFNNIIQVVFTISTFMYFFFYFIHRTSVGRGIQKASRYPLMLAFGVLFGSGLMLNLYFGPWAVLWMLMLGPATVPGPITTPYMVEAVIAIAVIGSLIYLEIGRRKSQTKTES